MEIRVWLGFDLESIDQDYSCFLENLLMAILGWWCAVLIGLPLPEALLLVMQGMSLFDVEKARGEDRHGGLQLGDSQEVLEVGPGETQFVTVTSRDGEAAEKRALWTFLPSYSVEAAVQVERGGGEAAEEGLHVSTHSNIACVQYYIM